MKYFAVAALMSAATQAVKYRKIEEVMDHFGGYTADYSGFDGNNGPNGHWRYSYERVVPERFTGDTADTFTGHMIKDFATEGHDPDTGLPTGHFFLTKAKAKEATYEVLATHLNITDKKAQDEYLEKYFDAVWKHMDVNDTGKLEAIEMNKFMRTLCKPLKENITLE